MARGECSGEDGDRSDPVEEGSGTRGRVASRALVSSTLAGIGEAAEELLFLDLRGMCPQGMGASRAAFCRAGIRRRRDEARAGGEGLGLSRWEAALPLADERAEADISSESFEESRFEVLR